ncbi:hypothetical protein [Bradyrhizobium yuanmingense]|uniref:hypothetical protein n=1 Tax=Bradyrhizobium yuanmingense TaxID=108015 RepID=UPI003515CE3F
MRQVLAAFVLALSVGAPTAQEQPFYVATVSPHLGRVLEFPSEQYRSCRLDAADDLPKIFFCTKREWIRAAQELVQMSDKKEEASLRLLARAQQLQMQYAGRIPDYIVFGKTLRGEDLSATVLAIRNRARPPAVRAQNIVETLYYKGDGSFEWQNFTLTENLIRRSIDELDQASERFDRAATSLMTVMKLVSGLRREDSAAFLVAPSKDAGWQELEAFSSGAASLDWNLYEQGVTARRDLIADVSISVSSDEPSPLSLRIAFGLGAADAKMLIKPSHFVNFFNQGKLQRTLEFHPLPWSVLRFLNSGRWDGSMRIWIDRQNKGENSTVRQLAVKFKYFTR